MIYLIEYDRATEGLVKINSYPDSALAVAEHERLQLELTLLASGVTREVVLLEARNEDELRKTHRRYFESLDQLLEQA